VTDKGFLEVPFKRMQAELAGLEQLLPQLAHRPDEQYQDLCKRYDALKKQAEQFKSADDLAGKLTDDDRGTLATLNACTRARKCMLVPYRNTTNDEVFGKGNRADPATGKGCCPGQTGHHLIPEAMTKAEDGTLLCKNYHHGKAPTVCVEGYNHSVGTHGLVHNKMDEAVNKMTTNEPVAQEWLQKGQLSPDRKIMRLEMTIEAAAQSHSGAFPFSQCSKKCIKAQLKAYYETTCSNGKFAAVKKTGHPRNSRTRKPKK